MNERMRRSRELLAQSRELLARCDELLAKRKRFDLDDWTARRPDPLDRIAWKEWWAEYPKEEPIYRSAEPEPALTKKSVQQRAAEGWSSTVDGHLVKQIIRPSSTRLIHGLASSSTINSHNYALVARGMTADLPVPILSNHTGHECPIGEIFYVRKSEAKVYVRGAIFDNDAADYAWSLIQCGDLRCFSGAAAHDVKLNLQGIVEGKKFYDSWRLGEASICRKGANPDSVFDIWDGVDDGSKFFTTATVTPIRSGAAA